MSEVKEFPYETRLNVLCQPLEVIDEKALADGCTHKWYNQTLCAVNDSVVRLGEYCLPHRGSPEKPSMNIEIVSAGPEQESILANLLELYAHDFSEFLDREIGADGKFGYRQLPFYWSEAGRYPFLVWVEGKLAGLVLVKRGSDVSGKEATWDMAEFFVLRGYRKRGIGTHVAHEVWKGFPGHWEVRVMELNLSAHHFWSRAISTFTGEAIHPACVEHNGKRWKLFSFQSVRVAG